MIFIDLAKTCDMVPKELIWWVINRKNVSQCYISIMKNMYEITVTSTAQ